MLIYIMEESNSSISLVLIFRQWNECLLFTCFLFNFWLFSWDITNGPVWSLFSENYGCEKEWAVPTSTLAPPNQSHDTVWLGKPRLCLDIVDSYIHEFEPLLCQVGSKLLCRRQPERKCVPLDRIKHCNDRNMNYVHNVVTYFLFNFEKVI